MADQPLNDEMRYRLIKLVEQNPNISQRKLAKELDVSLGKVNYCLKALIHVGWLKVGNFARSSNKVGYTYLLTPSGAKEKAALTVRFLERKQQQYDLLKKEIESLQIEVAKNKTSP